MPCSNRVVGRSINCCAVVQTVDWSVPKPGGGVNDYMEILVKETVTLHKVLSRYLSPPVVEVSVLVPFLFSALHVSSAGAPVTIVLIANVSRFFAAFLDVL